MTSSDEWRPSKREDIVDLFADALDTHESRRKERDAKAAADEKAQKDATDKSDADKDKTPPRKGFLGWLLGE